MLRESKLLITFAFIFMYIAILAEPTFSKVQLENPDSPGDSEAYGDPGGSENTDDPGGSETTDSPGGSEAYGDPGGSENTDSPGDYEICIERFCEVV